MKVRALIGRIAAVVVVLALAGGGVYLFMTQPAKAPVAAQAPPPPEVGVVELAAADVPLPLEFAGRVAGFRVVEIRAQVSGILLKREYLRGRRRRCRPGLFRIDPRTYEAALARASAQAAQARATLIQAEENYQAPGGPGRPEGRHPEVARGCHRRPRPGARRDSIDRGRRPDGEAQPGIHRHQGAREGADQPGVAGGRHADPGAADRCSRRSPSSTRPTSTSPSPTPSCAPCRRSTGRARSCSIPKTSRSSCSSAMAPPIPSPARSTRARARSIRGPAPS